MRSGTGKFRRAGVASLVAAVAFSTFSGLPAAPDAHAGASAGYGSSVRLLTVGAALTGGMFETLITEFEEETGYEVTVTPAGADLFDQARAGAADIVMAHWGFTELENFVSDGYGRWPRTVLSNTVAFIAPPHDPAGIRGTDDPVEALRRIAEHQSPFIVNDLGETRYISDTLWNASGRPDKGNWFLDPGLAGAAAVREAQRLGGYTTWGLHPFLMLQQQQPVAMEPVLYNDSLLQRIIATVVVTRSPSRINVRGALALEQYLTGPAAQGRIRSFRLPNIDQPVFWPAGNQNDN